MPYFCHCGSSFKNIQQKKTHKKKQGACVRRSLKNTTDPSYMESVSPLQGKETSSNYKESQSVSLLAGQEENTNGLGKEEESVSLLAQESTSKEQETAFLFPQDTTSKCAPGQLVMAEWRLDNKLHAAAVKEVGTSCIKVQFYDGPEDWVVNVRHLEENDWGYVMRCAKAMTDGPRKRKVKNTWIPEEEERKKSS